MNTNFTPMGECIKMIVYVFKHYGLYGIDDINFDESKRAILSAFEREHEKAIKKALKGVGVTYKGMVYYSPPFYNFANDTIDLQIGSRINKVLFKKAIKKYERIINERLSNNKSRDGYTALTVYDCKEELNNMNKPYYKPDIIVLQTIINAMVDTEKFCHYDWLVYDDMIEDELNEEVKT